MQIESFASSGPNQNQLEISRPVVSQDNRGCSRVSSRVNGREVYFESDTTLHASPEAFATAFLLPAMSVGANLKIDSPVCDSWLNNVISARACGKRWWGFSGGEVIAEPVHTSSLATRTGMFFSGGVDSFYTLLHSQEKIHAVVFVEGFDVKLSDSTRLNSIHHWLRVIADEKGVEYIRVRTNLREHPAFCQVSWAITHGAALAAIGYCLSARLSRLLIASTDVVGPHGSHPELDPAWSSGMMSFVNHGSEKSRLDKVGAIASEPLVPKYLRVCWENRSSELNCGVCEKCVRTQLQFEAVAPGFLWRQRSFPAGSLLERVKGLDQVPDHLIKQWKDIAERLDSRDLKAAATALLEDRGAWRRARRRARRIRARLAEYLRPGLH